MKTHEAEQLIDGHLNALMEHFEAVQILVSRPLPDGNGTELIPRGGGNWYARHGMAQMFLTDRQSTSIAEAIKHVPDERTGD